MKKEKEQPTTAKGPWAGFTEIAAHLLEKAGLTKEDVSERVERDRFRDVIGAFLFVHRGKARKYGDYYAQRMAEKPEIRAIIFYGEIKRKFIRLQSLAEDLSEGKILYETYADEAADILSDIGVYAAMGVDIFFEDSNDMAMKLTEELSKEANSKINYHNQNERTQKEIR